MDLSTLGVLDLDTSITLDVFGLRAFDSRESVVLMLRGDFQNLVLVLAPDATAGPRGFHDIILEVLSGTPNYWAGRIVPSDATTLRRRWPPSLIVCHYA